MKIFKIPWKMMHTNQKMAQSMAKTTTTMSKINKQMDVKKMAKTMQNFEKENMKMEMTEEMMNDAMGKFSFEIRAWRTRSGHVPGPSQLLQKWIFISESAFAESGDEEEADNIMNQVIFSLQL